MKQIKLAITPGDIAGIGPEVVHKALNSGKIAPHIQPIVLGEEAKALPGKPTAETASNAIRALDTSIQMAMEGKVDGLVTGPISKVVVSRSGIPFTGHTEYIAQKCRVKQVCMMFVAENLRTSMVTTHVLLRKVPHLLTVERIITVIKLTNDALNRYFGLSQPKIAVTGLNPHAGEEGLLGQEELSIIKPAIDGAKEFNCSGPYPADTIFRRHMKGEFDAVVAMYHDQALCAIKTFSSAATNVTLGLPFPRTSPDHGTAFDIAGKGIADPYPMINAINLCAFLAGKRGLEDPLKN